MDTTHWDIDFQHAAGHIRFLHRDPSRLRAAFYTNEADGRSLENGGYTHVHEASFPGYKPRGRTLVRVVFVVRAYKPNASRLGQSVFAATMEKSFSSPPIARTLGPVMVYDSKSPQTKPISIRECPEGIANLLMWELGYEELVELLDTFKPGWGSACYGLLDVSGDVLDVQAMEEYYRQEGERLPPTATEHTSLDDWPLSL